MTIMYLFKVKRPHLIILFSISARSYLPTSLPPPLSPSFVVSLSFPLSEGDRRSQDMILLHNNMTMCRLNTRCQLTNCECHSVSVCRSRKTTPAAVLYTNRPCRTLHCCNPTNTNIALL